MTPIDSINEAQQHYMTAVSVLFGLEGTRMKKVRIYLNCDFVIIISYPD
jgi:hypothetical protein